MSSFTTASSTGGIFRSEVPQQCFNEVKTGAHEMFQAFVGKKKWSALNQRVQNWSDQEVDEEVTALVDKFPDVEANFRYTVLRALKTAHQRNHGAKAPIRIRPENVENISLAAFYKSFAQRLSRSPYFQTEKRFNGLSPSDTDIVCKDAFRHGLSAYVRKVAPLLVVSEGVETMAAAQKQNSTVASTTESAITPQDSVSQAPSEVISIRPTRDDRLTASILRLHGGEKQKHAAESKSSKQLPSLSKASRASAKSSAKSYVRIPSVASRKSIVSVQQRKPTTVVNNEKSVAIPESDVIECDISTTKTRASTKSKRRSPKPKPAVPCFWEEESSAQKDLSHYDVDTNAAR